MISILEYLKHRSKQKYNTLGFPDDLNDADAIIKWLDDNDFDEVGINTQLIQYGEPCYCIGPMGKDPDTHWISVSDGETFYIVIRTADNFNTNGRYKLTYIDYTSYDGIDEQELYQYLDKIINSK